ncbi:CpsD/CapB family tyrosine-protein kinase [Paenibacillus nasutitermitis]|uniref:non-specific protein-tyrosine kinase n=1 Tax=Paenibacillus nasutitermitis TaxID=1652958 RepID=A0A916Z2T6_9BACL|nr:CpsD/CapB family tyrosine-protein kinase [Paenibacillus nasutitermitis]GGD73383.1 tyrosine protein kinase [Paenibacillus nasutitermitis]
MDHKRHKPGKHTANACLMSYLQPYSASAEQYKAIRNNIRYASRGKMFHTMIVTSPSPGEGKTTAAVNLAVCMAQQGETVLLIDTNIRKPVLQHVFGLETAAGLTNVLAGQVDSENAIHQSEIEKLDVLPSGPMMVNSIEMLDSHRMAQVLEYAGSRYDKVIFDSAPVLGHPDTSALATRCDGVILVFNSGKTKQEHALEAKSALEFAGATLLGAVLNKK